MNVFKFLTQTSSDKTGSTAVVFLTIGAGINLFHCLNINSGIVVPQKQLTSTSVSVATAV